MSLVIYTDQDLSLVESQLVSLFSRVKNNSLGPISYRSTPAAFRPQDLMKLRKIKSVQSMCKLRVTVIFPSLRHEFRSSPLTVLKYLFEHKGRGSLLSLLTARKLALDVEVTKSDVSDLFSYLEVSLDLTQKGFVHYKKVVTLFFEYVRLIRAEGVSSELVKEIQTTLNLQFTFRSKVSALDKVKEVALKLAVFPARFVNKVDFLMESLDSEKFQEVLGRVTPENTLITLKTDKFGELSQTDPYFGTRFQDEPLDQGLVQALKSILDGAAHSPTGTQPDQGPRLSLPEPNTFIPEDFQLVNEQDPRVRLKPLLIQTTPNSELFFLPDLQFGLPKVVLKILIHLPFRRFLDSPSNYGALVMFRALLDQHLKQFLFMAQIAQIEVKSELTESGLHLNLMGFNHKFAEFLGEFGRRIADFCLVKPEVESFLRDQFGIVQKSKLEELDQKTKQQPFKHYKFTKTYLFQPGTLSPAQLIQQIGGLSLARYLPVHRSILKLVYLEALVAGNVLEPDARGLFSKLTSPLQRNGLFLGLPLRLLGQSRVASFSPRQIAIFEKEMVNETETNNLVSVYFQLPQGPAPEYVNLILKSFLKVAFFDEIRTERQLGYIVAAFSNLRKDVSAFSFLIQSAKKLPSELAESVYDFVDRQKERIDGLSQAQFDELRKGVLVTFQEEFKSLEEETEFYFDQIKKHAYSFDKRREAVVQLGLLQKEDLIWHFNRIFFREQKILEFHFVNHQKKEANREHIHGRRNHKTGGFGDLDIGFYSSAGELQKDHLLFVDVERKKDVFEEL